MNTQTGEITTPLFKLKQNEKLTTNIETRFKG